MAGKVENKLINTLEQNMKMKGDSKTKKKKLLLALVLTHRTSGTLLSLIIASVSRKKRNVSKRKKSLILHGWESREQKTLEEYK